MKILRSPAQIHAWRRRVPGRRSVGFVPTMGALHEGHMALVRRSRRENDVTVVSLFVNPIQFGPKEDLSRYPRPFATDVRLLKQAGIQILFAPSGKSMYPSGYATTVTVSGLTDTLCGAPTSRGPEHFKGVATVVAKLFNIVRPDRAYFGMKDFQQMRVLERMTEDLNFDTKIVRCPTVREKDGLAMSSRNAYLSPSERALAPQFHVALQQGRKLLRSPRRLKPSDVRRGIETHLKRHPGIRVEYIDLVNPDTLQPVRNLKGPVLLAAAIRIGRTRLIDNLLVQGQ